MAGINLLTGKLCQTSQRNGYHECREYNQISRKDPACDAQIGGVPELDNGHVELAWQTQDSHHTQHQLDAESFRYSPRGEQLLVVGIFTHGCRYTAKTVENTKYCEQTYGYECQ